ncbi:acyltransferase family protein [Aeromicrobium endophyticum]|uniref:Acyltransferase n=1 Tax=Aeromicrobium endophyticum TaxID=2292704 RepID=A0A371P2T5_9ACTN|nr:acyltransferase family protein [Aeromicrobium endophyticum]REK70259.1 acyltransferase [Aeromicrobium endophyticum]
MTTAEPGTPSGARRSDIQGLRAVAATLIVAFHAGALVPGGFFAVDIFFVISGFVITAMLLREHATTGSISLRRFYLRRVRRLFPSLALVVAVTMMLSILLLSPFSWGPLAPSGLASLFAVSNVYFAVATDGYFQTASDAVPLLHTWSLSVEEQFYLVFPTVVLLILARGRRRSLLVWAVAIVTVLSFVLCVVLTLAPLPGALSSQAPRLAFYSPMTRAWEFGAGALAALALTSRAVRPSRWAEAVGWAGVLTLAVAFVVVDEASFPGWSAALPVAATVLLLVSGSLASPAGTLIGRALSVRPMTWLGDRSYTWYLWHWPMIVAAHQWWPQSRAAEVLAGVGALGVAAVVYRWFERPIHDGTFVRPARTRPLMLAIVGGAVACCVVAGAASATSLGDDHLREQRQVVSQQHLDQVRGCDGGLVAGQGVPDRCRWDVEGSRGRLLLVGDSHAGHYSEAFVDAAADLGYSADVVTFPSCPFALGESADAACTSFVRDNVRALAAPDDPYDLVVVSTAAINSVRDPDLTSSAPATAGRWRRELETTLRPVAARTRVVTVVDNVQFPRLMTCLRRSVLSTDPAPGCLRPGEIDVSLHDASATAQQTAMDAIGGHALDPTVALCGARAACRPVDDDGVPIFRDVSHITVDESHRLSGVWSKRLAEVLATPRVAG